MKTHFHGCNQQVNFLRAIFCHRVLALAAAGLAILAPSLRAQNASQQSAPSEIRIIEIQGTAEVMPVGAQRWVLTQTNQVLYPGDRVRTGANSRMTLRWSDQSVIPFAALTEIEILPPDKPSSLPGVNLFKGLLSFFHRDKPGRMRVLTRGAAASIEGTEFILEVAGTEGNERVRLAVIDGRVRLTNSLGGLDLTNSQQAVVEPGRAPVPAPGFIANNLLQWCFYYPGILDLNDLVLNAEQRESLKGSLDAYRQGDLLGALAAYPEARQPVSDYERIYRAALWLAVGEVEQTEAELNRLPASEQTGPLAESLQRLIAAVKRQDRPLTRAPQLATELMAASYYEQSRAHGEASLRQALDFARRATLISPQFGFAWERVAELEFGFGHTREAEAALNGSLDLSPKNAQALALKGFLLAARNDIGGALDWFNRAIATDGALGNAWLERGLCRIRRGDAAAGREDLLIAAAVEPQRSVLRSYLAKAFSDAGENSLANKEIALALRLDPADPTGWLYSALLKQRENRINEAIADLDESQSLNTNRAVFRSKMLLDEDRAVRSANLATMYHDAGMDEVALREAARAVTYDYANSSAHLFISDSFNELRDPTRFNLRYETVWFNELLLANLLAPVGAGRLSQTISSQEYSKLFESDGVGLAAQTSWRSDNIYNQLASQYGTFRNTSWALDLDYEHNAGVRPNNELNRIEWYSTVKQQLTPFDSILLLTKYEDFSSGDNFQYYNPSVSLRPNFKFDESQKPIVVGGYQHEWAPGIQTLMLGGRLVTEQRFSDVQAPQLLLSEDGAGNLVAADTAPFDVTLTDKLEIYTAELNQIVQRDRFTLVAGGLWQGGKIDFANSLSNSPFPPFFLPPSSGSFSEPVRRYSGYGYLTVEPIERLWLTGGLDYDHLEFPANFRSLPQSAGTDERHLLGPKGALVWSPLDALTVRGIYSQSLGGVSLDESYRLEPTQLAGFVQTFRSVIPESLVGSVSGAKTEVIGTALDLKLGATTFAGLQVEQIKSDVGQTAGAFALINGLAPFQPFATREDFKFKEQTLSITLNQLLPDGFVAGTYYSFTKAQLRDTFPQVPPAVLPTQDQSAYLHRIGGYLLFNHPSGFFAEFDAHGYLQSNHGYTPALAGDQFVQLDLTGGYRFFRRRGQLAAGVLNLTGQDYHLNPLTVYSELPRKRVFAVQLSFQF